MSDRRAGKRNFIILSGALLLGAAILLASQMKSKTLNSSSKPGDIITFGTFDQDGNAANGEEAIEWIVLDVQKGEALLVSRYALDAKPYDLDADTGITWEECTLRQWLNDDFLNEAFCPDEQKRMIQTEMVNEDNTEYGTEGGANTEDFIFCLSLKEADLYFNSDTARFCDATDSAVIQGARIFAGNGSCIWWLRSPGFGPTAAAYVSSDGSLCSFGNDVRDEAVAVRPALWVTIEE